MSERIFEDTMDWQKVKDQKSEWNVDADFEANSRKGTTKYEIAKLINGMTGTKREICERIEEACRKQEYTRFKSVTEQVKAWWSELANKQKIIIRVE